MGITCRFRSKELTEGVVILTRPHKGKEAKMHQGTVFATLSYNHLNHCHVVTQAPVAGASGTPYVTCCYNGHRLLLQCDGTSILLPPFHGCWNHACCHAAPQSHSPQMKTSLSGSIWACVSSSCFMHSTMGEIPLTKPDPSRTLRPALPSGLGALRFALTDKSINLLKNT